MTATADSHRSIVSVLAVTLTAVPPTGAAPLKVNVPKS